MRWNLLWYLPITAWLLIHDFVLNAWYVWHGLVTLKDYATQRILILLLSSKAAYLWTFCLFWLPLVPLIGTYLIPLLFEDSSSHRHSGVAVSIGLAAIVMSLLLGGLADQSWPFLHDSGNGHVRIRMLPFVSCQGCSPIWR